MMDFREMYFILFEEVMVEQGNIINGYYNYRLPEGVVVNDVFFVGWRQRSETFLNVGYDINTPHSGKQYYWINGEWQAVAGPGQYHDKTSSWFSTTNYFS